jgi:hypothetical protein
MVTWKTELQQQRPSPPYTRWDQRGTPVLLCYLKHIEGKSLCLSLQTADPDIAKRHMRLLVAWLLYKKRLSPDSGAAKVYGPRGSERSRLKKVFAEVRRLKALPEAEYGSQALAIAKRWGCPAGIIFYMAGRRPPLSAGTFNTRRMRRRARGEQLPKGDTWEHRPQKGKCFFLNRKVPTARLHIDSRTWQWPLKVIDKENAEAFIAPVRVARERLSRTAAEELNCEIGTDAAVVAAAARTAARAQLASAIMAAGGPNELAEFVLKGPQQDGGVAVPQRAAALTAAPSATMSATRMRQAAEKRCKQLLIERYEAYLRDGRKERPLKDELRAEMTGLIPNLSGKGFDRCWRATAVAKNWDWKEPGFRSQVKPPQKTPPKKTPPKI